MEELDVSLLLNYLESNFGINTASSTGIDLNTFTALVKKFKLGWSNGQIRHAMIFLSGERNLSSIYISAVNQNKRVDQRRKNKHLLSIKVNDFINKLVTIESGIPSNIATSQLKIDFQNKNNYQNSILLGVKCKAENRNSILSNPTCMKEEMKNMDEIPIEEYVYSNSELEEEIVERV